MTETLPIRILHNETLSKAYLKQWGIVSTVPPVHEQIESVVINRKAIFKNGYNPSIIRFQGRILLAYRYYPTIGNPATQLAVAELDEKFNVTNNQPVQLVPPARAMEDCKLWLFKDQLYCSYVEVRTEPATVIVKYGLLVEGNPGRIVDVQQPMIGTNDGTGWNKNFLFWAQAGKLMCIYQSTPEQIIYELTGSLMVAEHRSPGLTWPYGWIKGGTGPVPYQDKLLRFFHSTLENEPGIHPRRYYCGACLMEPTPPFRVIAISKEPVAIGSEICDMSETNRLNAYNYKMNVIFPGGVMQVEDGWWLSVGTNDCGCCLLKIELENINL